MVSNGFTIADPERPGDARHRRVRHRDAGCGHRLRGGRAVTRRGPERALGSAGAREHTMRALAVLRALAARSVDDAEGGAVRVGQTRRSGRLPGMSERLAGITVPPSSTARGDGRVGVLDREGDVPERRAPRRARRAASADQAARPRPRRASGARSRPPPKSCVSVPRPKTTRRNAAASSGSRRDQRVPGEADRLVDELGALVAAGLPGAEHARPRGGRRIAIRPASMTSIGSQQDVAAGVARRARRARRRRRWRSRSTSSDGWPSLMTGRRPRRACRRERKIA